MTPRCERRGCTDISIARVPVYVAGGQAIRLPPDPLGASREACLCALHEGELEVNGAVPLKREDVAA